MHNKKNKSQILKTLKNLNLVDEKNIEVFSKHTRDNNKLKVFKDKKSGVIFIDDYYVGINEYMDGKYKEKLVPKIKTTKRIFEENIDSIRRVKKYTQFVADKDICDFGCGSGEFLKRIQPYANKIYGVEPQNDLNIKLNDNKIKCYHSISEFNNLIDVFFLFHSFEHLPNPMETLKIMYKNLKKKEKGRIVIEVPHANDFLINNLSIVSFIKFTLWSQHLILHTRESLKIFLQAAGFRNISIEGVQRYNIANHINWLRYDKPSGHKEILSILESEDLKDAYSNALSRIDANDTLVAIAST